METAGRHTEALSVNPDFVKKILIDFIRDEIHNVGFRKGIVGLSGGVDSAVALFLAAAALGKENVLAVLMPYRTSSPESLSDARLAAAEAGVATEIVEITPMVDAYLTPLSITEKIRAGNVMARQRMIVLYDISSRDNALVIGTSNKTEILLGYGTLFGDLACAINPLGDLYKTQVWQLAEALSVPRTIIGKKPSADLWEGQTDEGEFGFSYQNADQLLFQMVDERRTDAELRDLGHAADFIAKVRNMVQTNQFKRRPPLIAKVSNRTFNVDFRYARDWGT